MLENNRTAKNQHNCMGQAQLQQISIAERTLCLHNMIYNAWLYLGLLACNHAISILHRYTHTHTHTPTHTHTCLICNELLQTSNYIIWYSYQKTHNQHIHANTYKYMYINQLNGYIDLCLYFLPEYCKNTKEHQTQLQSI